MVQKFINCANKNEDALKHLRNWNIKLSPQTNMLKGQVLKG